jgi:hypothetical protein
MEFFTLALFVLGLLVAALLVTQTIRRELKSREQLEFELRRESMHARPIAKARGRHAPHAPVLRQHTQKSPPNSA